MLGLGLGSHKAKAFRSIVAKLYGKLRRRSTYFENNKKEAKEIDDYKLLNKATILLTPAATSDALVHSVKTYTGDDLVTNGTFDTDSDWSKVNSTISSGKGNLDSSGGSSLLWQDILTNGNSYKATFTISDYNGTGTPKIVSNDGATIYTITSNGTFTINFTHSIANGNFLFRALSGAVFSIDNVSVVDVSSDFDFDRASSATRINSSGLVQDMQSITDPELVLNGDYEELGDDLVTNGDFTTNSDWNLSIGDTVIEDGVAKFPTTTNSFLIQTGVVSASVKTYKLQYEVIETNGNNFRTAGGNSAFGTQTLDSATEGVKTVYITSNGTNTALQFNNNNFIGSIDNISLQQVDPNDRWTLGTGWSIENGVATSTTSGGSSYLTQSGILTSSNTYKITFTVSNYVSGTVKATVSGQEGSSITANGTYTEILTTTGTDFSIKSQGGTFNGSVDNVSVKDITFSTDVDLARINYDSNGANGHILLEPTSTNLITYSEDFSEWSNTASETTDTPNSATSPSGESNATKLQEANTSNSLHRLSKLVSLSSGTNYSLSIFAKKGTLSNIQLMLLNTSDSKMFSKVFNLENGTLGETLTSGGQSLTDSKIEDIGNGWYRCSIVGQLSTTPNTFRINLADASTGNTTSNGMVKYTGDGNGNIYIYGAQLEALPYATSYIPTLTGSTVTRATETLNGSGNSTLINSTEGVLYAEIAALSDDLSNRMIALSDSNSSDHVRIYYTNSTNKISVAVKSNGSNQYVFLNHNVTDITDYIKIAVKYKANDFATFINGVKVNSQTTTASAPVGLDRLNFDNGAGTDDFYGKCKALAVFNEALEDDELELLTGVTNYPSFGALAAANGYTII